MGIFSKPYRMTRAKNNLTAVAIAAAPAGKLSDGAGLVLVKTDTAGKWLWRYSFAGSRREMGLGSYPAVTLATARKSRDKWAGVLAGGKDPITERERQRDAEKAEMDRTDPTLAEVAVTVFEARKAGLRGDGTRGRWFSPLAVHVLPKIGGMRISQIHQSDIHRTLKPIWATKVATAEKTIQRLGVIFRQAKLMGLECDPFTVDAARHMLGEVRHEAEPITATPWQDIPDLYARLCDRGVSHQALRMMILTAVRSAGVRGMRFGEVDGDIWTVPADRVKGREGKAKPFRVPLSQAALDVLAVSSEYAPDYVFPGQGRSDCISDVAIQKALNMLGEAGRPHGFRTSFRTWCEETEQPWDAAETALGHTIKGKVERAYARSDLLDRRRVVMDRWAAHVTGQAANVVRLRG
jgi:integrase